MRGVHRDPGVAVFVFAVPEDLVFVEFKVDAQSLDNLCIGARFNFQPHSVTLAAVMQLHTNSFK